MSWGSWATLIIFSVIGAKFTAVSTLELFFGYRFWEHLSLLLAWLTVAAGWAIPEMREAHRKLLQKQIQYLEYLEDKIPSGRGCRRRQ